MIYYKPKIDGWFWTLIFVLTFTLLMVCSISEDGSHDRFRAFIQIINYSFIELF